MTSPAPNPAPASPGGGASALRRELLVLAVALVTGAALGILWQTGTLRWTPIHATLDFVAELFMRLLRMIVVPLVITSVISGIASIELGDLRRLSLRTIGWYVLTTALAVLLGLVAVNLVRPGDGITLALDQAAPTIEAGSVASILLSIVPDNPVRAMTEPGSLLGVIFFSILIGVATASGGEAARPVRRFFEAFNDVIMRVTTWVLWLTPIGVLALLFRVTATVEPSELVQVVAYMATVTGALAVHAVVVLPLLLVLVARVNPARVARGMTPALVMAFSTASSSSTLPQTVRCASEQCGVERRVAGFVLPLGATVNMDGTALYEAVAAMFVAQAWGIALGVDQQVLIFITATLAAIGAAGVPSAGLVTMVIVFEAVGLPLEGIGLVLAVDRVLDMARTAVNVWGDSCGAVAVASMEGALDRDVLNGTTPGSVTG